MKRIDVLVFAELLERAGYEDPLPLLEEDLIPIAQEKNISLWQAAHEYADSDADQDTAWYQLHLAFTKIPALYIDSLNIHEPL